MNHPKNPHPYNPDAVEALASSDLLAVSDAQLVAHACKWMANQTETGNGSISRRDREDTKARLMRMNQIEQAAQVNIPKPLSEHDAEYVRRLREIANKSTLLDDPAPKKRFRIQIDVSAHNLEDAKRILDAMLERVEIDGAWNSVSGDGWIKTERIENAVSPEEYPRKLKAWLARRKERKASNDKDHTS